MEKLTPFIICAAFIFISFCFWVLATRLSSYAARKKILAHKNSATKEATGVVLISYFGELSVMHNVCLPTKTEKGMIYVKADNIVILPTCIAVIQIESRTGQIFTHDSRIWKQSVRSSDGTHQSRQFENPVLSNERNIIALTSIFEKEGVTIPTIRNIVIFSSDDVVFSEDPPETYSLSKAIEKMKTMSRGERLPISERIKLKRIIKKYSVPVSKAREHNARILTAVPKRPAPVTGSINRLGVKSAPPNAGKRAPERRAKAPTPTGAGVLNAHMPPRRDLRASAPNQKSRTSAEAHRTGTENRPSPGGISRQRPQQK